MIILIATFTLAAIGVGYLVYLVEFVPARETKWWEGVILILGLFNIALFAINGTLAITRNTSYYKNMWRIEIEERRAAIVQELNQADKDILLQGIQDAKEFNVELKKTQYTLAHPFANWINCPVWNEFEPIEY